jgi:hypothetical protein
MVVLRLRAQGEGDEHGHGAEDGDDGEGVLVGGFGRQRDAGGELRTGSTRRRSPPWRRRRACTRPPHAAVSDDPAHRERFWHERLDRAAMMITRAVERGELRPDCDPRLLIESLQGVLFSKVLFFHEPLYAGLADELVDQLLRGVR